MIQGLLEDAGYSIVGRAIDGKQAVEMTASLRPDVVLMDIRLPGIDGVEATRQIQDQLPHAGRRANRSRGSRIG